MAVGFESFCTTSSYVFLKSNQKIMSVIQPQIFYLYFECRDRVMGLNISGGALISNLIKHFYLVRERVMSIERYRRVGLIPSTVAA